MKPAVATAQIVAPKSPPIIPQTPAAPKPAAQVKPLPLPSATTIKAR
jgi:hypothetical protein